ncbi:MAG TPA: DUF1080 domain-containing protein [Chitinophagaceae bacterium]|nr:DUF1080 domain-containing protein [Chitinophagaceae bacterium]
MFKALFFISCFVSCIFYACSSSRGQSVSGQSNTLTSAEKNNGWVLLFEGKTTNGWHTYNKNSVTNNWKVADGALVMDPKLKGNDNSGDLVTNNEYENYEFSTEWRISEEGNSGIIFDIKEDPKFSATYNTGAEMQVLDNIKAEDNKQENHLAGLLYDMSGKAALSKPKPVGDWNTARIIQNKGHLTFYFNGIKTLDMQYGSDEWKNMVANSKFKTWPNFMTSPKGKIAFQDHGHEVAFRNVKIKML